MALHNRTTFEPKKMSVMVVSQKKSPFDAAGIVFEGEELRVLDETTLVGITIDSRLRWGPMVDKLATKARQRLGALSRVRHLLDSANLKTIYSMFIRSIMEYSAFHGWVLLLHTCLSWTECRLLQRKCGTSSVNHYKQGGMQLRLPFHSSFWMVVPVVNSRISFLR